MSHFMHTPVCAACPNGISIGSAVLAAFMVVINTDRQTDHIMYRHL